MSTSVQYIPIEIWVGKGLKRTSYEMHKQLFIGNRFYAKEKIKEVRKEYPMPKFIVRRLVSVITIYKK